MRRYKGISTFRAEATSIYYKLLTNMQEKLLINQINKLTIRKLPLTSHIVKNLIKEIIRQEVNKNWIAYFIKRYFSRLKSLYLQNIDNLQMKFKYKLYI
jgi:NAD-dependent SIR2 family protein deacetylase